MKSDFFQQKPADVRNASDRVVEKMDVGNMFYDAGDGTKVFRVCFDVGQFSPEEIELRTQDHRLTVHAVHQQQGDDAVTTTTTTTIVERGTLELWTVERSSNRTAAAETFLRFFRRSLKTHL